MYPWWSKENWPRYSRNTTCIDYVNVNQEGSICTVKGKICPEHVQQKDYILYCRQRKRNSSTHRMP